MAANEKSIVDHILNAVKEKSTPPEKAVEKKIIGLVEKVKIIGSKRSIETEALIDSGATRTSVDLRIAARAGLGPVVSVAKVKSKTDPQGYTRRAVVKGEIELRGIRRKGRFTLSDRSSMAYPVLVGRDVIHSNFVLDISKSHESHRLSDKKKP